MFKNLIRILINLEKSNIKSINIYKRKKILSNCYYYYCTNGNNSSSSRSFSTCSILHQKSSSKKDNTSNNLDFDLSEYPVERIRNFSIIAHIDHGKSTLADRLLEITGTIQTSTENKQILDKLQVERERGITVKAQSATMKYMYKGDSYLLNLIDTPGHVDFSYEVARSLFCCDGVILLIDANQGVQAQTLANFYLAFAKNLVIMPVLNKIDLKNANPERVMEQLNTIFEIEKETVLKISAKLGIGIEKLLENLIETIPPPKGDRNLPTKALLYDSWYDKYKGVGLIFLLKDGNLKLGDNISLASSGDKSYEIKEIGVLNPNPTPANQLFTGQVGYLYCNMRSAKDAQSGDTIYKSSTKVEPLPGFAKAKPMVFSGVYPVDQSEHLNLRSALEKLLLNDPSVECQLESSPALGNGWRLGFLGVLHLEVFSQRLEQEYGTGTILTAPNVPIKVKIHGAKNIKEYGGELVEIKNPLKMPIKEVIKEMYEPFVTGTIITPSAYMGDIMSLCLDRRGVQVDIKNIDSDRMIMVFKLPLNEIVVDFYDKLKSITSGYASFDYEELGYEPSELDRLDILMNGEIVNEMAMIVHVSKARELGKSMCAKLKESIQRHQFLITVQAALRGKKILAREDIRPYRKDVAAKLYGGDVTRKQKLLKKQNEGKSKMRKIFGRIELPREAYIKILQR